MCNLLSVFIMQLRSHIWWGWYQQGILGSHASIMAPVKLEHYKASVINPCDQYTPPPRSYLWMAEFDKGAAQVGSCRSHDTSTKEPSEECGQDRPPHLYSKIPKNFDAPYHNEYPLCPLLSQALICAVMPRRGAGAAVKVGWGGYTDSGCVWSEGRQPLAGVERSLANEAGSYLITWRGSGPFSHN